MNRADPKPLPPGPPPLKGRGGPESDSRSESPSSSPSPSGEGAGGRGFGFHRPLAALTLAALVGGGGDGLTAQEKVRPFLDPERAFSLGDTDKDGKLSKDEFDKLMAGSMAFKEKPKAADFLFARLDADKDGTLTFDEFRKVADLAPPKDGSKKGFLKKGESKKADPTPPPAVAEKPATAEQLAFFEKKIRPVLVAQCYSCHSEEAKKSKGNLLVDNRDGLRKGGDNGPALIPGDPKRSLLMKAIHQADAKLKMPPKSKLDDEVVADFEKWIAAGAADPRGGAKAVAAKEIDIEAGRKFWAFQPPKKTPPPVAPNAAWAKTDLDRFVLAGLDAKGLKPVADADPRALVRRLYFDLTGLPPTPEDVEAFARDPSLNGLVDKLLASERFGETWGRHWLDVARYAESSGKAANMSYPHAWRYRDYVVGAFNADKPFDQFVREQLAGDLMTGGDDRARAERTVATAFLAIGPKAHNERSRRQFEMDLIDEQIDTTTQAFLGLTVSCARCHDHKFDPIPQKDYYALAGIFRSTETCYGTTRNIQSVHPSPLVQLSKDSGLPAGQEPLSAGRRAGLEKQIADLKAEAAKSEIGTPAGLRVRVQLPILESQLAMFEADGTPKLQTMAVRERPRGTDAPLLGRGEVDKPGEMVRRGLPQVLTTSQPAIRTGSGRKELADWVASKDNPLTARVYVNRVWHHLFGQGLVPTPDNFGASGQKPSNPALLDHLAVWFMDTGWSTKKLIRLLVTSHAYQLATTFDATNHDVDPDNALLWRMSPRRLEAEKIRDAMLTVSGQLDLAAGRGSEVLKVGEAPAQALFRLRGPFAPETVHRAIYMTVLRDQLPEALTLFDFPDPSAVAGERPTTTVPAQALYLLNNPFVIKQAEGAADRLLASSGSDAERVKRAYETFFGRPPTEAEQTGAAEFLTAYGKRSTKRGSWAALAQAMMASAEFANLK